MILEDTIGYGYKDVTIIPAEISDVNSRKEVNVYDNDGMLPLFTAPMVNVVSLDNFNTWCDNKINAIIPRTVEYYNRIALLNDGIFVALSQSEFTDLFTNDNDDLIIESKRTYRVCIDTANGHMKSIFMAINTAKERAKNNDYNLIVMVGNIANPETYRWICNNAIDVDYVRVGIGSGKSCITSTQTAVHYPMATLIDECRKIRDELNEEAFDYHHYPKSLPKIVADGGIRGYDDIITALALGADYVMLGSVFAALQESAADTVTNEGRICKRYFGMSTREAQKLINAALKNPKPESELNLKTAEGTVKYLELGTSVNRWVRNFNDYLRSAMSYTNCHNLNEFNNNVYLIINSANAINAVNK